VEAQLILGNLYVDGQISRDEHSAFASLFSPLYLDNRLLFFENCTGLISKETAALWYGKAAQQGSALADTALATLQPALLLERAKERISNTAGRHVNFGSNIKARRAYYSGMRDAVKVLTDAGYKVTAEGFGYTLEPIQ
jgi:TPR repeat protein